MTGDLPATPTGESPEIDSTVPRSARVYNYLLGGTDNFPVDREAAEPAVAMVGGWENARDNVWAQRALLGRVVRHLAGSEGIRQFLDIGSGIPTVENTHEIAQQVTPAARIVYVDYDPIVAVHANALLASTPEGVTAYVEADLRDVDTILEHAAATLDFDKPAAVILFGILHHIEDEEDPWGIVARLMDAMPSGSYLAISQLSKELQPEELEEMAEHFGDVLPEPMVLRSREEVTRFFDGLELVEPGVVLLKEWRPDDSDTVPRLDRQSPGHCGVARKP